MGYTSNMDNHPGKNSLFDVATADDIVYRLEISFEYQDGFLAGLKREYDGKHAKHSRRIKKKRRHRWIYKF